MEKTTIKDYNNGLETKDSLSKVKAVDASGNDILVNSKVVAQAGGCGSIAPSERLSQGKWYRIALGRYGNVPYAVLLIIGNYYNNEAPNSQLLYIHADGYSDRQSVVQLANSGRVISKARILYKASPTNGSMLDIFVRTTNSNQLMFSYSCNINFIFQSPVEVPEEPDAGYLVKEFTF
ncbi:hypothetical protein NXV86_23180 [Bacteroides sp. BFG-257]|uniref:hypothetical protein n=1 Tax=Bacteroides TaxID=816 RepID=UPI001CCE4394|nr:MULTISPECIES: hypothetical protein [Bacteroides]UBD69067.1 hypothetical protein K6V21_22220 [Bacteroides cellulosilyticus]UVO97723.1 hypothetical protein NXV86_23180 [Bacteroides sp. BFG-257]